MSEQGYPLQLLKKRFTGSSFQGKNYLFSFPELLTSIETYYTDPFSSLCLTNRFIPSVGDISATLEKYKPYGIGTQLILSKITLPSDPIGSKFLAKVLAYSQVTGESRLRITALLAESTTSNYSVLSGNSAGSKWMARPNIIIHYETNEAIPLDIADGGTGKNLVNNPLEDYSETNLEDPFNFVGVKPDYGRFISPRNMSGFFDDFAELKPLADIGEIIDSLSDTRWGMSKTSGGTAVSSGMGADYDDTIGIVRLTGSDVFLYSSPIINHTADFLLEFRVRIVGPSNPATRHAYFGISNSTVTPETGSGQNTAYVYARNLKWYAEAKKANSFTRTELAFSAGNDVVLGQWHTVRIQRQWVSPHTGKLIAVIDNDENKVIDLGLALDMEVSDKYRIIFGTLTDIEVDYVYYRRFIDRFYDYT